MSNPDPIALSVPDAAKACAVSERQMWRILKSENLPQRKLGRRTVILYEGLQTYMQTLPETGESK